MKHVSIIVYNYAELSQESQEFAKQTRIFQMGADYYGSSAENSLELLNDLESEQYTKKGLRFSTEDHDQVISVWQCFSTHQSSRGPILKNVGNPFMGTEKQAQSWTNLMYDTETISFKPFEAMELSKLKFEPTSMGGVLMIVDQNLQHLGTIAKVNDQYKLRDESTQVFDIDIDQDQLSTLGNFKG